MYGKMWMAWHIRFSQEEIVGERRGAIEKGKALEFWVLCSLVTNSVKYCLWTYGAGYNCRGGRDFSKGGCLAYNGAAR